MERKSFLFYKSYVDAVNRIPDINTKYQLLIGIINFGLFGERPHFKDELSNMAWVFIEPLLDANYEKFLEAHNNGIKGGAPRGNQNARKTTQNNPKQPNTTQNKLNDNVKVNVNDNATVNATVNVNDNDNVNDNVNVNINKEICPYVDENGIITDWDNFQEWKSKHPF